MPTILLHSARLAATNTTGTHACSIPGIYLYWVSLPVHCECEEHEIWVPRGGGKTQSLRTLCSSAPRRFCCPGGSRRPRRRQRQALASIPRTKFTRSGAWLVLPGQRQRRRHTCRSMPPQRKCTSNSGRYLHGRHCALQQSLPWQHTMTTSKADPILDSLERSVQNAQRQYVAEPQLEGRQSAGLCEQEVDGVISLPTVPPRRLALELLHVWLRCTH